MRTVFPSVLVLLLGGCLGEAAATPEELARYEFVADVKVNPSTPIAGRQVSFNLELTSRSNQAVVVDVILRAVRANKTTIHEQIWRDVSFRPEEVWNLTQGFVSNTNEKGEASVVIETREAGTEKTLWMGSGPSITFK
jgi:hypothetical protein